MLYRLKMQMENIASAVTARVKRFLERMEGHARVRMVLFFALLVLIGGVMFLLNMHTPLMMDDYDYSFSWSTGARLAGIGDILASQAAHYRLWGGRSVTHFLAQLSVLLNRQSAVVNENERLSIFDILGDSGDDRCFQFNFCHFRFLLFFI